MNVLIAAGVTAVTLLIMLTFKTTLLLDAILYHIERLIREDV